MIHLLFVYRKKSKKNLKLQCIIKNSLNTEILMILDLFTLYLCIKEWINKKWQGQITISLNIQIIIIIDVFTLFL